MKQLFICVALTIGILHGTAQDNLPKLKIGGFAGFATYSFESLENLNKEVKGQLPFQTAVIDNFPVRISFGGHVLVRITSWYAVGPAYEFHSTGSRIGERDYSGSYHFDQIVSAHQLGLENEIRIIRGLKPALYLDISGGVNFSSWKMEEVLKISDESIEDRNEYDAIKPYVFPALKINYPVYRNLSVFARAGYLFDVGGKYHLSGNKDYQSALKIPWTGFRAAVGLEFTTD
jgi:hypothetical protein